ncbi:hypothetical protein [Spiroplasma endosymbiont of Glossina fuscipes fuscipes]
MTKEQLSLDNMKIKKDANEKARLIDLTRKYAIKKTALSKS